MLDEPSLAVVGAVSAVASDGLTTTPPTPRSALELTDCEDEVILETND